MARTVQRDTVIDLVRAFCLVVVVLLHAMMAGITVNPAGAEITNALAGQPWFAPVSWLVQVMPLFFLAGGFTGLLQWQRYQVLGARAPQFIRARMLRLLIPALALIVVVGGALTVLQFLPVPASLIEAIGFRIGQPLWFLAVFVAVTALVPLMAKAHTRGPKTTLLILGLTVPAVDGLAALVGMPAVSYVNLIFVWLFMQQLGFFFADGSAFRIPRKLLPVGMAGFLLALLMVTTTGLYSADMYENLNPPTLPLILLGLAQLCLLLMVYPKLRGVMEYRPLARAVTWMGSRAMTIYLWHVPAIVGLGVLAMMFVWAVPDLYTQMWWATRPAWLLLTVVMVAPVLLLFAPMERMPGWMQWLRQTRPVRWLRRPLAGSASWAVLPATTVAVVFGVASIAVLLVLGFSGVNSGISLALAVAALLLMLRIPKHGRDAVGVPVAGVGH